MTKVSSGKPKSGPPAHANTYAFHHNKSSKLTKHITSLPIRFLCPACVAVIEWRKKYRKYKPLTVVKRCTACGEKKIKDAYHVICGDCVRSLRKCGKCLLPEAAWIKEGTEVVIDASGEVRDFKNASSAIESSSAVTAQSAESESEGEGEQSCPDSCPDSCLDSGSDSFDSEDCDSLDE